ncbi:Unknown protein [Striga hermonthica]|uniref:Uncharacterized protein n=1 Tax=Striga hermonthica TaxID=68872 RepID=A0A9N7RCV4_STRHE|nr:Unknown protein [Striga hermonthica]
MTDWGPVFVAVVLFVLLTPGLLIQIPARSRSVAFGSLETSGLSILLHSILYFLLICPRGYHQEGTIERAASALRPKGVPSRGYHREGRLDT